MQRCTRLPTNGLKFDRGFVPDLEQDSDDAAIAKPGQALRLGIVAEGVETDQQQDLPTRPGSDALQGFLLGHPLPPQAFMADIHKAKAAIP